MFNIEKFLVNFNSLPAGFKARPKEAYRHQAEHLKKIWNDDTYGIERAMRLLLCCVQFVFPILLIRDVFGRHSMLSRRMAVEFYTLFKLLFPVAALFLGWYRFPIVPFIVIYLLSETVLHILNLIFLSDVYGVSASYHRSVLLLCLHYFEVVFDFAVIYLSWGLLSEGLTPVSALYFSLVANTTVGFGDIYAKGSKGQLAVVFQLLIGVLFILVFINYFSQLKSEKRPQ